MLVSYLPRLLNDTISARNFNVSSVSREGQSPERNAFKLLCRRRRLLGVEGPSEGHASHFQRELRRTNDAAHGQEAVHLVAHMHKRDGHAVVLQFAGIGHSLVGERVATRSQYQGRGELFERGGPRVGVVASVSKIMADEIFDGLDRERKPREIALVGRLLRHTCPSRDKEASGSTQWRYFAIARKMRHVCR